MNNKDIPPSLLSEDNKKRYVTQGLQCNEYRIANVTEAD